MYRPKGLAGAILLLANGGTVVKTFCPSEDGFGHTVRWSVHPGGHTLEAKHVARFFELECLRPVGDGLFPGETQQFEWVEGSQSKFSKRTVEKLPVHLQPGEVAA